MLGPRILSVCLSSTRFIAVTGLVMVSAAVLGPSLPGGVAAPALAETLTFQADLSGRGEAPANDSVGTGHLDATLDTQSRKLTWTCTYSGMTGAATGAHFHGPVSYMGTTPEENAPIQVGTPGNLSSPFSGSSTLDPKQAKELRDGRWYFNVHTAKYPNGEIRGPIVRK